MGKHADLAAQQIFTSIASWQNEADAKLDTLIDAVARLQAHQAGVPLETALKELKNEIAKRHQKYLEEIESVHPDIAGEIDRRTPEDMPDED